MEENEAARSSTSSWLRDVREGKGVAASLVGWIASALTFLAVLRAIRLVRGIHVLYFDDAYMFYRYAVHVRSGLGVSWNLDGVPTYGLTSLTWLAVVFPLSFLHISPGALLPSASFAVGLVALAIMALAAVRAARGLLRRWIYAAPLVVLPLLPHQDFFINATNGMDTMLGMVISALVVWQAFCWIDKDRPAYKSGIWLGVLAFAAFFTRPETALCACGVPLLLWILKCGRFERARTIAMLVQPAAVGALLIAAGLLTTRLYFKSALPLSFYLKRGHAYSGYGGNWPPLFNLYEFIVVAQFFVVLAVFAFRQDQLRMLTAYFLPVAMSFFYLGTVQQIMGFPGRYYMPFLPFLVVPALWSLDRFLLSPPALRPFIGRAVLGLILLFPFGSAPLLRRAQQYKDRQRAGLLVYLPPRLETVAGCSLPDVGWFPSVTGFSDHILQVLPAGSVVASSEVGYPGAMRPDINIIDEAGLNDRAIAFGGFTADRLLDRRPDVIWMPHPAYTWMYGTLLSSPRLYREYTVYAGVLNSGLALRKDGASYARLKEAVTRLELGRTMSQFEVTGAKWEPMLGRQGAIRPWERDCAAW